MTIFYFSGTGNSYYIAKKISENNKAELISITSAMRQSGVLKNTECIGIVFPVYYGDVPNIINNFVGFLKELTSKYIFVVCTYGGGKGDSLKTFKQLLEKKGGRISSYFGVKMPQSTFKKANENRDKLYQNADAMIDLIGDIVGKRKKGFYFSNILLDILSRPVQIFLRPVYQKHLIKMAKGKKYDNREALIYQLDSTFTVNEKCTGCKICTMVCPVHNVKMVRGKPTWIHHCENCIACYNFCPNHAIETKLVEGNYYYLHPDYSVSVAKKK